MGPRYQWCQDRPTEYKGSWEISTRIGFRSQTLTQKIRSESQLTTGPKSGGKRKWNFGTSNRIRLRWNISQKFKWSSVRKEKLNSENSTILKNDRERNPKVKQVSESKSNICETSFKDFESELKSVKVWNCETVNEQIKQTDKSVSQTGSKEWTEIHKSV